MTTRLKVFSVYNVWPDGDSYLVPHHMGLYQSMAGAMSAARIFVANARKPDDPIHKLFAPYESQIVVGTTCKEFLKGDPTGYYGHLCGMIIEEVEVKD